MLIPEKLNAIIRILLAGALDGRESLTVKEVAKKAGITSAIAKRLLVRLEASSYLKIRGKITLLNPLRLMKGWGYTYSLGEIGRSEFVSAERPQYVMLKIANWARKEKVSYAFTLFSATEQVSPYVSPSTTHMYILQSDQPKWEAFFKKENIIPAEKEGNVVCFLTGQDYLEGAQDVRGMNIVSLPQLYADLISFGGRGEDAAQEVLRTIDQRMKHV